MRSLPLLLVPLIVACATAPTAEPSLAPRAAEAIDPRVPIPSEPVAGPVDAGLAARLDDLMAQVRQGDAAFQQVAATTERLVAAAGPAQSESWIEAQQSLSALVAARGSVTRAIADIDALAAARLVSSGGILPGDLAAIQAASAEAGSIGEREAATIDRLQARLGG